MSRPDWVPEAFAYHAVTPETCYGCGAPARHYAVRKGFKPHETRTAFYWWCDSPECEQAAREAICGEKMAERVEEAE